MRASLIFVLGVVGAVALSATISPAFIVLAPVAAVVALVFSVERFSTASAMQAFTRQVHTQKQPAEVQTEMITTMTGPLHKSGYDLIGQTPTSLTYNRRYRPWWVWVLVVFTFPLGLLFLLLSRTATITVNLQEQGGGTAVTVVGVAPADVRSAFAQMEV
jgi:hypothetical protein